MEDQDRIAKLPVWAQDRIYLLERKLDEVNAQLATVSAGPEDSNVRIRDHVYPDRLLGYGETVDFLVEDGFIQVGHDKHDANVLEVRAVAHGMKHSVVVKPTTGNSFKVWLTG